jgi:hypothetical protein
MIHIQNISTQYTYLSTTEGAAAINSGLLLELLQVEKCCSLTNFFRISLLWNDLLNTGCVLQDPFLASGQKKNLGVDAIQSYSSKRTN